MITRMPPYNVFEELPKIANQVREISEDLGAELDFAVEAMQTTFDLAIQKASTARTDANRYWDIFTADDGGRLVRLCWKKNGAGNFMAMEVAELVTWNNAAEQREAEESMLQMLNIAEKNREWLRKRADGEDRTFCAAPGSVPQDTMGEILARHITEGDSCVCEPGSPCKFHGVPQAEPPK